ncbi:MAG: hypothetical protein U5K43_05730 [Halofilum sp. (in: g-proteobacteria)]|nr:hypothetical protein [Halofilum sp. (in: g-proteobacteria)]
MESAPASPSTNSASAQPATQQRDGRGIERGRGRRGHRAAHQGAAAAAAAQHPRARARIGRALDPAQRGEHQQGHHDQGSELGRRDGEGVPVDARPGPERAHRGDRGLELAHDLLDRHPRRQRDPVRERVGGRVRGRALALGRHASQVLDQALACLLVLEHVRERAVRGLSPGRIAAGGLLGLLRGRSGGQEQRQDECTDAERAQRARGRCPGHGRPPDELGDHPLAGRCRSPV